MKRLIATLVIGLWVLTACDLIEESNNDTAGVTEGDMATVIYVVDGDTIAVRLNGQEARVRYIGMNTPENDEPCYSEATAANARLVQGQQVRLVRDTSDTDQFGRLLRYVYVGNTFVNEQLVRDGYAEVVSYPPDTKYYERFRELEREAAQAKRGCHPTGIFDDGSERR